MNHLDLINGVFECGGAILTWLNVLRLRKDREVKGVDWRVTGFWSAWGLSNLYYYFALGHWVSWAGGVVLVAANITWVCHAIYYGRSAQKMALLAERIQERLRPHKQEQQS